jgi:hypothetical protein
MGKLVVDDERSTREMVKKVRVRVHTFSLSPEPSFETSAVTVVIG